MCNLSESSGEPYKAPDPPPLIKARVKETNPFDVTGVDCLGLCMGGQGMYDLRVFVYLCCNKSCALGDS